MNPVYSEASTCMHQVRRGRPLQSCRPYTSICRPGMCWLKQVQMRVHTAVLLKEFGQHRLPETTLALWPRQAVDLMPMLQSLSLLLTDLQCKSCKPVVLFLHWMSCITSKPGCEILPSICWAACKLKFLTLS